MSESAETTACNSPLAAETAGITYQQLDHWTRLGHLRPGGGWGTGYARWWTDAEVEVARRMGAFLSVCPEPGSLAAPGVGGVWCGKG